MVARDPTPTDEALLEAWRDGDARAGGALAQRHFMALYRFFATKVDEGIEDLIQRVYLKCVESLPRFRGQSSFRTYMFAIARNELYGRIRSRRREAKVIDWQTATAQDLQPSPSRIAARRQEQAILLRALRSIPIEQQLVLELYFWERLRARELAEILELPEGTVRTRIRLAREALRRRIDELSATAGLGSVSDDLDRWAAELREVIGPAAGA
jgi:RNA polymerase sigma factor (sigma-70 family)